MYLSDQNQQFIYTYPQATRLWILIIRSSRGVLTLEITVVYTVDRVYVSGQKWGILRKAVDNYPTNLVHEYTQI